jgi:quinoprotein glucose dehydrogenase
MQKYKLFTVTVAVCVCFTGVAQQENVGWDYNGGPQADHYSPLTAITPSNVSQLRQTWKFDMETGGLESQPIVVGRTLYALTPTQRLVALDAANGTLKWAFDPQLPGGQPMRGLTSWTDGKVLRLVFSDQNHVFLIDSETGKPVPGFGKEGSIDTNENLRGKPENNAFFLTSPAVVYKDLIIVGGGRVAETSPASPGDARAYDVHSGKLVWTFHTIPHPGDPGADTWPKDAYLTQGGSNSWGGTSVDVVRGIVFINTGSPADDFYGANRLGNNRLASSTIAIDANTGKRIWDFQLVHHDLWDSDSESPPVLTTITRNGKKQEVAIATNKQSYIYTFDRLTGRPIYPIDEKPFPPSTVPGEQASPTQPIPVLPKPMSRKTLTVDDLSDRTPEVNAKLREIFAKANGGGGAYVPLAVGKDTFVLPGFVGGNAWGGMAVDHHGILYANVSNPAFLTSLVDYASVKSGGVGEGTYSAQCAVCHGINRQGDPPEFPALVDIGKRLTKDQITAVIRNGRSRMPAFSNMPQSSFDNLVSFLTTGSDVPGSEPAGPAAKLGPSGRGIGNGIGTTKYVFAGYIGFAAPDGGPALKNPSGLIHAIDMNTGQYLWTIEQQTGGGPTITESGILFISGGGKLNAFDAKTGKLIWAGALPSAGLTPITYMIDGKQYVAVETGGGGGRGRGGAPAGNAGVPVAGGAVIAFALPN